MQENIQENTNLADLTALLTTQQAAALLGYKPRMLEARRVRGDGPKYVRISARAIRYRPIDLHIWIESRLKSSTSEP